MNNSVESGMIYKPFYLILSTLILSTILCLSFSYCSRSLAYDGKAFSIDVPDNYRADSESIADYTSLYGDKVTVGIRTEDNVRGEDVTTFTESHISDIINDTISSLDSKGGKNAHSTGHSITSFSDNRYPSLFITYEGNGETDSSMYIEEYIITTAGYIYTIVFSADDSTSLKNNDVDRIKAGFTVKDQLIVHSEPADESELMYIFIVIAAIVVIVGVFVVVRIVKSGTNKKKC